MATGQVQFGPKDTDVMSADMAEGILRELFESNRSAFAMAARRYFLNLYGGQERPGRNTGGTE